MDHQSIWQQLAAHHDTLCATHGAIRELFAELDDEESQAVDGYGAEPLGTVTTNITNDASAAQPSALELFTGVAASALQGQPVYTMIATDFTREQYHASKWTDDMLVSNGRMTIEYPKPPAAPAAPPAPAAAPTPTAGATPTPAGTSLLRDKAGVPWDARIHSSSRTINEGDGNWKKKKGVSPTLVAQVTSELLAAKPAVAGTPFAAPPAAPAPAAPSAAVAGAAPATAPPAPAAPGNASEAVAQARAAAEQVDNPTTFKGVMDWLKANNLTTANALEAAQVVDSDIEGWGFLARPEYVGKIPEIVTVLKAMHGK